MYKYQYNGELEASVSGVGIVKPGQEFESDQIIQGPNFTYIGNAESPKVDAIAPSQPNAVTEARLIDNNKNTEIK